MTDSQHEFESIFGAPCSEVLERSEPVPWKILIADDEPEVHAVTQLVLKNLVFDNCPVDLMSAYSGEDTLRLVEEHPDVAVIILDVVMETDSIGLEVVRQIRENFKNSRTRIILRTGQPGQAPAKHVIMAFDINDYREKTELTSQKLVTSVTAALRSYRDLRLLENNSRNLKYIIDTSPELFGLHSIHQFAGSALNQFMRILASEGMVQNQFCSGMAILSSAAPPLILAGSGKFLNRTGKSLTDPNHIDWLNKIGNSHEPAGERHTFSRKFHTSDSMEIVFYLSGCRDLDEMSVRLLKIVGANIGLAFDNLRLNREIRDIQHEITHTMVQSIESRYWETGQHVRRIAEQAHLMGKLMGMDEDEAHLLKRTAPMHDVGKIGLPDSILMKHGKLKAQEFEIVKKHPEIGYKILNRSTKKTLQTAAIIALQHHEQWQGGGYPQNLSGTDIHLFSRITQIVDVFDTLSTKRIYKSAWSPEKVLQYMESNRDKQFEARLADVLVDNFDAFNAILRNHPDQAYMAPTTQ